MHGTIGSTDRAGGVSRSVRARGRCEHGNGGVVCIGLVVLVSVVMLAVIDVSS